MDKFEKVKLLGRGAQGTVSLVRKLADRSLFVVKEIELYEDDDDDSEDGLGTEGRRGNGNLTSQNTQLMTEIKILALLSHPYIVGYYGSFVEHSHMHVVMEFADRGSVHDRIQHVARHDSGKRAFSEGQLVGILTQLLLALQHVHGKGVLHRDIKPKNVFLHSETDTVKLGDFGLALEVEDEGDEGLQPEGEGGMGGMVGTPQYLPPEVVSEGRHRWSAKGDVWGLGCLLLECTLGFPPFQSNSLPELLQAILNKPPPEMPPEEYSPEFRELVLGCLSKDPTNRPSVDELLSKPILAASIAATNTQSNTSNNIKGLRPLQSYPPPSLSFDDGLAQKIIVSTRERVIRRSSLNAIVHETEQECHVDWMVSQMRSSLQITDRVWNHVPYFSCFLAKDCVDFLVRRLKLHSRQDAMEIGKRWMELGVFFPVAGGEQFPDDGTPFRFHEEELSKVLNLRRTFTFPPRPAAEVARSLSLCLRAFVTSFVTPSTCIVDYNSLCSSQTYQDYQIMAEELQVMDAFALSLSERKAFFLNLFNVLVLHGNLVVGPPNGGVSARWRFFNQVAYSVGGLTFSLNDALHGVLRANRIPPGGYRRMFRAGDPRLVGLFPADSVNHEAMRDPRVHCAVCLGSRGSPPLQAYFAESVDDQLDQTTREFCSRTVEVLPPVPGSTSLLVRLPEMFQWYQQDFSVPGSASSGREDVLRWIAQYLSGPQAKALDRALQSSNARVEFKPHDWTLNKPHQPGPPPPPPPR